MVKCCFGQLPKVFLLRDSRCADFPANSSASLPELYLGRHIHRIPRLETSGNLWNISYKHSKPQAFKRWSQDFAIRARFPVGTSCKPTHPTRYDGWLWGSAGVSRPKNYDHPTDPSQSPSLISQIIDQHLTSPTSIDSARGSEDDSVLQSLAILRVKLSVAGHDPMIFPLNWLKPWLFDG